MKRTIAVCSLPAIFLAGLVIATGTEGKNRRGCKLAGGEVLVQTETGRVITSKVRTDGELEVRKVYGCLFDSGRLVKLGTDRTWNPTGIGSDESAAPPQQRIEAVVLDELPDAAGEAAAYSVRRCTGGGPGERTCKTDVRLVQLPKGKLVAYAPDVGVRVWEIRAFAPAGVAFIAQRSSDVMEVHRLFRQDDRVVGRGERADDLAAPEGWRDANGSGGLPGLSFYWRTETGIHGANFKCGITDFPPCPQP